MQSTCPYHKLPPAARWSESVGRVVPGVIDPTARAATTIDRNTRIASAGSCFAQHIRNHLVRRGYSYLVTEPKPDGLSDDDAERRGYGLYPARFGNIYTTVQLWQLFQRAFGDFSPREDHWVEDGRFRDPFRPFVEPRGFSSFGALVEDRQRHLSAARRMFESLDVFVFTLGLTETWRSRLDGAVFPVCPGCRAGTHDPRRHEFVNLDVSETADALFKTVEALRRVNARARVILTVSPVPLIATMTGRPVVQANAFSKSVLRVAAEMACQAFDNVEYFPSYEIITGTYRTNEFFSADRRTVTDAGVSRVMDLFFQAYADGAGTPQPAPPAGPAAFSAAPKVDANGVVCDEEIALREVGVSSPLIAMFLKKPT